MNQCIHSGFFIYGAAESFHVFTSPGTVVEDAGEDTISCGYILCQPILWWFWPQMLNFKGNVMIK